MHRFSQSALILLPKQVNKESRYMTLFNGAMRSLIQYLNYKGVTPLAFSTDCLANELRYNGMEYLMPLSESDEFFARNNCLGMDNMPVGTRLNKEIAVATKKHPNVRGLSREQRFELMQKRELLAVKKYIDSCKLVFTFAKGKNQSYKLTHKEGDGLLRIYVDSNSLIVKPILSGKEISPHDVFDFSECSRPLYSWKEENYAGNVLY